MVWRMILLLLILLAQLKLMKSIFHLLAVSSRSSEETPHFVWITKQMKTPTDLIKGFIIEFSVNCIAQIGSCVILCSKLIWLDCACRENRGEHFVVEF